MAIVIFVNAIKMNDLCLLFPFSNNRVPTFMHLPFSNVAIENLTTTFFNMDSLHEKSFIIVLFLSQSLTILKFNIMTCLLMMNSRHISEIAYFCGSQMLF